MDDINIHHEAWRIITENATSAKRAVALLSRWLPSIYTSVIRTHNLYDEPEQTASQHRVVGDGLLDYVYNVVSLLVSP